MKVGNLFACFFSSSAAAKVKSEIKRIAKGPGTWGIEVVVVARRGCEKKKNQRIAVSYANFLVIVVAVLVLALLLLWQIKAESG